MHVLAELGPFRSSDEPVTVTEFSGSCECFVLLIFRPAVTELISYNLIHMSFGLELKGY